MFKEFNDVWPEAEYYELDKFVFQIILIITNNVTIEHLNYTEIKMKLSCKNMQELGCF